MADADALLEPGVTGLPTAPDPGAARTACGCARRRVGHVARRPPRRAAEAPDPVDPRGRASASVVGFLAAPQVRIFLQRAARRHPAPGPRASATRSSSSSRSRSSSGSSWRCRSCSTRSGRSSRPGLTPNERKLVRPWIPIALVFFASASSSPTSSCRSPSQFLLSFTDDDLEARPAAGQYFDFVTTMFLAFGLLMEFPILLVGLSRVGIVTSAAAALVAPDGHPRDRDLRGGRDAGRRPRQPVRPRRDDVRAVRADDPVHPAQRAVTDAADPRMTPDAVAEPAVVILSGLSGGGKTAAAKLFEDLGYTVVDNLPGELLPDLAELVSSDRAALRARRDRPRRPGRRRDARPRGHARRARGPRHPAAGRLPRGERRRPDPALLRDAPPPPARRRAGHRQLDRRGAPPARARPGRVGRRPRHVATCRCAQLRERLFAQLATDVRPDQLAIQLISFGFKFGVPLEADLVFDVRFMQNPYYVAELRQLSGLTDEVRAFVLGQPVATRFLDLPRGVPRRSPSRPTSPRARPA